MAETAVRTRIIATPSEWTAESPSDRTLRRLLRRRGAVLGLAVIALFVAVAVLAPLIAPYDPTAQTWTAVRKPPSLDPDTA